MLCLVKITVNFVEVFIPSIYFPNVISSVEKKNECHEFSFYCIFYHFYIAPFIIFYCKKGFSYYTYIFIPSLISLCNPISNGKILKKF